MCCDLDRTVAVVSHSQMCEGLGKPMGFAKICQKNKQKNPTIFHQKHTILTFYVFWLSSCKDHVTNLFIYLFIKNLLHGGNHSTIIKPIFISALFSVRQLLSCFKRFKAYN